MRFRRILPLILLSSICAGCGNSDESRFQGLWDPEGVERGTVEVNKALHKYTVVEFFKDTAIFKAQGMPIRATFRTDATAKPRTIDLEWGENEIVKGIYEFRDDGKTLVLCLAKPGSERPERFETNTTDPKDDENRKDDNFMLITLKKRPPSKGK